MTAAEVIAVAEARGSLGSEMRQLRKARGMTLNDLSQASGISLSHISAIERGASNPSVDVVGSIASALAVSANWLFACRPGSGPMERAYVVRSANRRNLNALYQQSPADIGYRDSLLSSSVGGLFYMGLAEYGPGAQRDEEPLQQHEGEQHGMLLAGELEMQIGDELITLHAGDSYSFNALIPHHGRNRTERPAKLVWAVSPVVIPKNVVQPAEHPGRKPPQSKSNSPVTAESVGSLGSEVRQLRKARGLTLNVLSKTSGISLSHISAIERGASNPSVDVVGSIAAALSVSPNWFFARRPGVGPMEQAYVVRSWNRRNLNALYQQSPDEIGYHDSLLSSSIGGKFYMGLAEYDPGAERPEEPLLAHDGEEHGFVLEGELEMQLGEEYISLRAGDSYSFDARIPHHGRNRSSKPAKLVWAVSPVVIPKDLIQPVQ